MFEDRLFKEKKMINYRDVNLQKNGSDLYDFLNTIRLIVYNYDIGIP